MQPLGHRLAKDLGLGLDEAKLDPLTETDPLPGELEDFEGRLIEYHRLQKGSRPRWNNIGGSVAGAAQVQGLTPDDLFEVITGPADSFFVSRRTLRQLAADPTSTAFEEHLHTARIRTIMFGQPGSSIGPHDLLEQVHALGDGANEEGSRIRDQGYLAEPAPFSE